MYKFLLILLLVPIFIFGIAFQNNYFISNPALAFRMGAGVQTYYSSPTDYGFSLALLSSRLFYINGKFSYSTSLGLNGFFAGYDSKGIYGLAYKNDNFYLGLSDTTKNITKFSSSVFALQTGVNFNQFYLRSQLTSKKASITYSIGGGVNLYNLNLDVNYSPKDFLSFGAFYQGKYVGFGGDYILKYNPLKTLSSYRLYLSFGNWVETKKEPYFLYASFDSKTFKNLDAITLALNRFKNDPYCKGMLVRIGNVKVPFTDLGVIEEIRTSIKNFRAKGKRVIFYLDGDSTFATYYLASAGDKIYMPPLSNLYGLGYYINVYKIGGFFKMLGINIDEITAGKYKSTFHSDTEQLSEQQKDDVNKLVQSIYDRAVYDISQDRAIDPVTLENFMNGQIIDSQIAKSNKLIDNVAYFSDALNEFPNLEMKNFSPYIKPSSRSIFSKDVYVLPISGIIVNGGDFVFPGYVTDEWVVNRLSEIESDPNAGAVILRINSVGGSAIASEHIWRKLDELRRHGIFTVASMEGVAASGAYYIASGCDTIIANPMTITGNIGVVYQMVDYSQLLKKLNIREYTIKTGYYNDMYSGTRPLTPDERDKIQKIVNNSYDLFLKRVSQGRRIPLKDLQTIADGKIYTGTMASKNNVKLIDSLGGLNKALSAAKNYLNDSNPNLIYINYSLSIFDRIKNILNPAKFLQDGVFMY